MLYTGFHFLLFSCFKNTQRDHSLCQVTDADLIFCYHLRVVGPNMEQVIVEYGCQVMNGRETSGQGFRECLVALCQNGEENMLRTDHRRIVSRRDRRTRGQQFLYFFRYA